MDSRSATVLNPSLAVACDHVTTIPKRALGTQIGLLLDDQEDDLSKAIRAAFGLDFQA